MTEFEKLDTGLMMALRAYEENRDSDPDDGISVSLRFEGDLAAIEALGFEIDSVSDKEALGVVRFKDIPALVEHPGVIWIGAGRPRRANLNTAVKDIRARASAPISGAPVDGLWHAVVASGAFTNVPNASGKDVIVAIIDTGIDYKHPMFMSQLTPTKKTRILRIWDQGLTPAAIGECPSATLLASTNTYGVQYKDSQIEADLNGGTAILHKDCDGHGTHVAGIAAGGVKFPTGGDASKIGVAPEAHIIAVKYLDTPDTIRYRLPAGPGTQVGWDHRLKDAVLYCLRTARELGKPVVVNMSFGDNSMPGDALDNDARWLDGVMDPTHAAGADNFPTGAVVVTASGNDGDATNDRQVARIVVPASGQITVPLELKDTRGTTQTQWKECAQRPHKPDVGVHFWYRRANPFTAVKFALRLPHQTGFSGDMGVGGFLNRGFVPRVGPPPSVALVTAANRVHSAFVRHEGDPSVPHPSGTSLRRHRVHFWVEPKDRGGTIAYHPGIYEMRIKAPQDTEIFAMCEQEFWAAGKFVTFSIATQMQDGSAPNTNIQVTSEFSATDTLGQHVITVAAYDDSLLKFIASFSSRGPLRDFSDPASPLSVISKPDIAAPGVDIDSAEGVDTEALLPRLPSWNVGVRFTGHSGTSQAAPMVAGVIALMLDKKNDLNTTQVRTILSAAADKNTMLMSPNTPPASTRAYGSGMVDALPSHTNTP